VDEVRYNDKAPWPPAADGSGPSLQRIDSSAYGNDPINWASAPPSPGQANTFPELDTDGDSLPDAWELDNGTNPYLADADEDPDGDGYTNRQEYIAGTNPHDLQSRLQVDRIEVNNQEVTLQFLAVANRTYTLLWNASPDGAAWATLTDVLAAPTNRIVTITDSIAGVPKRFYRLASPAVAPK
jgi:hypothetical protein